MLFSLLPSLSLTVCCSLFFPAHIPFLFLVTLFSPPFLSSVSSHFHSICFLAIYSLFLLCNFASQRNCFIWVLKFIARCLTNNFLWSNGNIFFYDFFVSEFFCYLLYFSSIFKLIYLWCAYDYLFVTYIQTSLDFLNQLFPQSWDVRLGADLAERG